MSDNHDGADPALEWFREIVEPTVADFFDMPSSKMLGCLAVLAEEDYLILADLNE